MSGSRTTVKTPKENNGSRDYAGRIEVGPLIRHADPARGALTHPAGDLLAEREVFLDGEPYGLVRQWQRRGRRTDQYGQSVIGHGLPTEWEYQDPHGVQHHAYRSRSLGKCLFESITVYEKGSI